MTREEILQEYNVDEHGIIRTLGRFEGEMLYVPHFWDIGMNGFADADKDNVWSFDVTEDDRMEFPELGVQRKVELYQRDDGFIVEVS